MFETDVDTEKLAKRQRKAPEEDQDWSDRLHFDDKDTENMYNAAVTDLIKTVGKAVLRRPIGRLALAYARISQRPHPTQDSALSLFNVRRTV